MTKRAAARLALGWASGGALLATALAGTMALQAQSLASHDTSAPVTFDAGSIDFDELQSGLGDRENGEELMKILRAADTDGNGQINYSEFLAATMNQQMYAREEYLQVSFNMLDQDGSGKIDSSELL